MLLLLVLLSALEKLGKIEFAGSLPRCGCVHKFKWKCSAYKLNCYSEIQHQFQSA